MAAEISFAAHGLDRADHLRTDADRLAQLRAGPDALLLALDGLAPELDADDRLVWTGFGQLADDADVVFLGLKDGAPAFAAVPNEGDDLPAYAHRKSWAAISRLSQGELALYGGARSLVDWHARHRFCAKCGAPTVLAKGGWQRDCPSCEAQHFPRTDPVAIMLVENSTANGGELLLGRGPHYPARSYSALAGFIEPGETIEQAVSREVLEEAGVTVHSVSYIASQPWPFPSQLMIGCHGFTDQRDLTVDYTELEDARWFTRAEVAEAMEHGRDATSFIPPPRHAIANHLLRWWLEQET
ncbi:NAD(+) diphosphatase [Alteraurantiacibacter aestuarii]|uniref:NAD(+) diphosphatase n=1 Tax=Alteraurantiacibacter aestuarii TaxID=650004 RepID=A0A844ZK69_9SPHN|nr:NAD(+) diphosphatase [Alteraurantiacibacter aestuarii]MXO87893.1 NAD(+) diphosphatase [Alteraurantiacibacter aestuarii]